MSCPPSAKLDIIMERLEEQLLFDEDSPMDVKLLDRYLNTIMARATISLPKLPTRVEVSSRGEPTQAIQRGEELQRFMNMADLVVANRLGSGRSPDDVIDIEGSRPDRLELPTRSHPDQGVDSPT
jgi:hypothetical protein